MITTGAGVPELSLRQLKSAWYVVQYRNVTKAASQLNRSQTAITKAISDLESSLGKTLFDRSTTGMMPTVYGEALAHRVSLAAIEFERAGKYYQEFKPEGRDFKSIPIFTLDISYKRLAAFLAVFEQRDIAGAANRLNITKAAVYNSVRQIEELLELSLFEREPNGMTPTAFCSVLAQHTKLAFSQIRHAIEDLANLDGIAQGSVVIGTLPYTRTFITPRAINRLLEHYPDLDVSTMEGPYQTMETALRCGDIDCIVGAVRPDAKGSDIKTEVLFEDRLSVIARKGHPLSENKKVNLQDLQDVHWVLPRKETPTRQVFEEFLLNHDLDSPQHAVETSSATMVRGLLMDSDRVTLLSAHQVHYDILNGMLDVIPVDLDDTYRPIGITTRAHTEPSPAAELFLNELRKVAADVRRQSLEIVQKTSENKPEEPARRSGT